jgi:hypothetical protein
MLRTHEAGAKLAPVERRIPWVAAIVSGLVLVGALVADAATSDGRPAIPAGVRVDVEAGQGRTFTIQPGADVVIPAGAINEGDVVVCEGKGGVTVGEPGTGVGSSAGISAETELTGDVHATCEPGPPAQL